MRRASLTFIVALAVCAAAPVSGQTPKTIPEMWNDWCARCHARDGSGRMPDRPVAVAPMDFTDCRVASPEPDADWALAIRDGGPAVGLSAEMPAFGETLSAAQIQGFVTLIRAFCAERGWPHGNLNFPRPIFTEKAFPENELVLLPMASHSRGANGAGNDGWTTRVVYGRRLGRRAQLEASMSIGEARSNDIAVRGLGDLEVGVKHVLATSVARSAILSGGVEMSFPTGEPPIGHGRMVFEPYLSTGFSRGAAYFQSQLKLEIPTRGGDRAFVYNTYVGRDLSESPTTWTAGLELSGENRALSLTPQLRKGLTRTGALAAAAGARVPLNRRDTRGIQWIGYLLWEYLEPVRAAR